jgi:hypothetical protein
MPTSSKQVDESKSLATAATAAATAAAEAAAKLGRAEGRTAQVQAAMDTMEREGSAVATSAAAEEGTPPLVLPLV